MIRVVPGMLAFAVSTLLLAADPPASPPRVETRTLTVSPAAAPSPALKFELLPRLRATKPGNRALEYARAFDLRPTPASDAKGAAEREKQIAAWENSPVDKLPVAEVKEYLKEYANTLKTLDNAVRLERYDGEWLEKLRVEGITLLLPGVQIHREAARMLKLRHRVDLAEGRYEDAARTLQSMMRQAKDVGENPTLIQILVGISITQMAMVEVEQWVQQPGAPNLYWALTTLPQPFIDSRLALEGEATFFDTLFPHLKEFEKGPLSADRANELLNSTFQDLTRAQSLLEPNEQTGPFTKFAAATGQAIYVAAHYAAAKKALLDDGFAPDLLEKMPPAQVTALRSIRFARALYDDMIKGFSLPYTRGRAEFQRQEKALTAARGNTTDVLINLVAMLTPAVMKVHEAYFRTERRLAALRLLEAIRMHAAAHDGKPPKSLADLAIVFVPGDPFTGKPFEYSVDGAKFTIYGPTPPDATPTVGNTLRYEMTLRGK